MISFYLYTDVVSIPKTNENFRLLYDTKGRFRLHSIRDDEAKVLFIWFILNIVIMRASPGAAVKLCLGDLLVMGSNPETASLHMQG